MKRRRQFAAWAMALVLAWLVGYPLLITLLEALGFPGRWLRIGRAQELHLIGRNSDPGQPPRERHFALEVRDADAWATRLGDHGVTFEGPNSRPDGARQIFLRDPDGHVIELLELATRSAGA